MLSRISLNKNYKWFVVALLWTVSFCNYADRSVLSVVMPKIKIEFGLSNPQLGLLSTSFLWVYAGSAALLGYLADKTKRKNVVIGGLVFWSVVCLLTPLASTYLWFFVAIALTGLGEASYYPAGTSLISSYHQTNTRARALSIHQTAVFVGGALGTSLAALLAERYQWRIAYYLFGAGGVLLALVLSVLLKEKSGGDLTRSIDRSGSISETSKAASFSRSYWVLCGLFMAGNFVTQALMAWIPTYMNQSMHLTLAQAALYGTTVLNMATLIAILIGGPLGDWAIVRTLMGRYYVLAFALVMSALFVFSLGATTLSPLLTASCLAGAGLFKGLFDANIYAAVHDITRHDKRATAVGVLTTIGFAGAAGAPLLVGMASKRWGLGISLAFTAFAYLAGAILVPLNMKTLSSEANAMLTTQADARFAHLARQEAP